MKTQYEHCYLKAFFVAKKMDKHEIAEKVLGMSRQSLDNKLSNRTRFTTDDIAKFKEYFHLTDKQVNLFFHTKVAN